MAECRDRIYLQGLRVACVIGARPEERNRTQEIGIDVCLHLDLEEPGRSDRLEDTVDYGHLAGEVASLTLAHPKVERVEVKVSKPHALPRGRAAAVEIFRDRSAGKRPMGFGRFV